MLVTKSKKPVWTTYYVVPTLRPYMETVGRLGIPGDRGQEGWICRAQIFMDYSVRSCSGEYIHVICITETHSTNCWFSEVIGSFLVCFSS